MDWGLLTRAVTLFSIGAALTLALSLLQVRQGDSHSWLLVPLSASGATAIGLLYPYVLGGNGDAPDGSKVMRCVAVFVGIYQASIKIDFFSYLELVVTLAALAVGVWWLFDRSTAGFLLSLGFTLVAIAISRALLFFGLLRTLEPGFLYSRLLCIYFSGCIMFGTVGRRLAAGD